jgi:hypothetical protein
MTPTQTGTQERSRIKKMCKKTSLLLNYFCALTIQKLIAVENYEIEFFKSRDDSTIKM